MPPLPRYNILSKRSIVVVDLLGRATRADDIDHPPVETSNYFARQ